MTRKRHTSGFTLVELSLVIGILTILAGIILVVLAPARRMSQVAQCMSNLRQIGLAYRMYRDDYGMFPQPGTAAMSSYIKDRRILFCPADTSFTLMGAATSYDFRLWTPPDMVPLAELREPSPNLVLAFCRHHVGPQTVALRGDRTKPVPPLYPYHIVLRADGRVERVHISRVRRLWLPGNRPIFMYVYPGEPGYAKGRK